MTFHWDEYPDAVIPCPVCDGEGTIQGVVAFPKSGYGQIQCPECDGYGEVDE